MKLSFLVKFILLAFLGWVVLDVIDPLDPTTVSTPFCLGIVLTALSLRQSTTLVVTTCLLYIFLAISALIRFHLYSISLGHVYPHFFFSLFQRTGLFLVVCSLAVYLAHYRTAAERTRNHLQNILSKLPAPVVISDGSGLVIYSNETLCEILKQPATELIGMRYVDLFMKDIQEGKAMRYYIEMFSGQDKSIHEMGVRMAGLANPMKASLICLGTGSNRVLVTLLTEGSRAMSAEQVLLA
jgi:PAS domain-containing protein